MPATVSRTQRTVGSFFGVGVRTIGRMPFRVLVCTLAVLFISMGCFADDKSAAARFRERVQPLLESYCYGCHGYGASEGNRTLDEFESDEALVGNVELWLAVLKNVRAGIMPPAGEDRPTDEERERLFEWIKQDAFGIDPANPDPGRVTIRRLNRVEYRNTIRDLMGVDYNTGENFPADDTGYGFDNIGDALSISPLLMEKYLKAAETITEKAIPTESRIVEERRIAGSRFRGEGDSQEKVFGERLSYYKPASVGHTFTAKKKGRYRVQVDFELDGQFEFDPGRCKVTLISDGKTLHEAEYGWADGEDDRFDVEVDWKRGKRRIEFKLEPLVPEAERVNSLDFRIRSVLVQGPIDEKNRIENENYIRFFPDGPPPEKAEARDDYARKVLRAFATRAFRRPVDDETVERLAAIAKAVYSQQGQTFETGVARALVAVLASPRFLFRTEEPARTDSADEKFPLIDEYSLATRLSYFLWSSMPDGELMRLAAEGQLRKNLPSQVERMLKHDRSDALVENFAGQWLRARDVENMPIDPVAVMGLEEEWEELRREFRRLRDRDGREGRRGRRRDRDRGRDREDRESNDDEDGDEDDDRREALRAEREARERLRERFGKIREVQESFPFELRRAMRQETEMYFEHILREDRSLLELIDSDYTFLNERLAEHYGIEGVDGDRMRRVGLPADSPRGGLLTQGTLLVVTSNPTRTSPVKRGLYILDNILGTPPPPPPPDIPALEQAAEKVEGPKPTVRELQEIHRRDPLCHSCHARMDPLGLALENFNAMGIWRDTEQERPIDASGTLLTGEEFGGIRDLKRILKENHDRNFYRCVTEKLLTYALGRGLEYYDEHTVDQIVEQLVADEGKFSTLVNGVINSAAFQRQRRPNNDKVAVSP
jgi:hypothetical protein